MDGEHASAAPTLTADAVPRAAYFEATGTVAPPRTAVQTNIADCLVAPLGRTTSEPSGEARLVLAAMVHADDARTPLFRPTKRAARREFARHRAAAVA